MSTDDEQDDRLEWLLSEARQGSVKARGELLEACRVYLTIMAEQHIPDFLRPKVAPSDLVQETFLKADREFDAFAGVSKSEYLAWLRKILNNNFLDAKRRYVTSRKREIEREFPIESNPVPLEGLIGTNATKNPDSELALEEQVDSLKDAMKSLADDYRIVLELRHRDCLQFDAIAQILEKSPDWVRYTWTKAIKELRRSLD